MIISTRKKKKTFRGKSSYKDRGNTFEDFVKADIHKECLTIGIGVKSRVVREKPKLSGGESDITNFLLKNNISFEREKSFEDLVNPLTGQALRFDFWLQTNNCVIEFDGIQHYKVCAFNKTEQKLSGQKYRDRLKNNYCTKKGIRIIRIKYNERTSVDFILKSLCLK